MTKTAYYTYLGTNGTITSPVHLEDIYYIVKYRIVADEGYILTNGKDFVKTVTVPENEISNWKEIKDLGQE